MRRTLRPASTGAGWGSVGEVLLMPGFVPSPMDRKLPLVGFGPCRRAAPSLEIQRLLLRNNEAPAAWAPSLAAMTKENYL